VGTTAEIEVALQLVKVAVEPLNDTVLAPCTVPKFVPVMVTRVPTGPEAGDKLAMPGIGNTVKNDPVPTIPLTVTTTLPVVAPTGTTAMIEVALQLVAVAVVPLKVTVLAPWVEPKFTPVIVMEVPTGPDGSDKFVIVGVCDTVNGIPLLACPLTVTTTLPVVAAAGTTAKIVVGLQVVVVACVPLNVKVLAPWVEPKFVPVIVTEALGTAMFGDKLAIDGARICGLKLTTTLSKVTVARTDGVPLLAAKPTYTFGAMVTVWFPSSAQFTPSGDA